MVVWELTCKLMSSIHNDTVNGFFLQAIILKSKIVG